MKCKFRTRQNLCYMILQDVLISGTLSGEYNKKLIHELQKEYEGYF